MTDTLVCVPNISEGRDTEKIARIAGAHALLDVNADVDHDRSVLTYGGQPQRVFDAVYEMIVRAVAELDIREHTGVHPRFGVVDVVPFVTDDDQEAVADFIWRIAQGPGVPTFTYGRASRDGRTLPELRRTLRREATIPHPTAGVICIGIRDPLIAFNVNLDATIDEAKRIAREIRCAEIRALGFELPSRGLVQVSMNLVAPDRAGPQKAFELVSERSAHVVEAEVVGLVPHANIAELHGLPLVRNARSIEDALASST